MIKKIKITPTPFFQVVISASSDRWLPLFTTVFATLLSNFPTVNQSLG